MSFSEIRADLDQSPHGKGRIVRVRDLEEEYRAAERDARMLVVGKTIRVKGLNHPLVAKGQRVVRRLSDKAERLEETVETEVPIIRKFLFWDRVVGYEKRKVKRRAAMTRNEITLGAMIQRLGSSGIERIVVYIEMPPAPEGVEGPDLSVDEPVVREDEVRTILDVLSDLRGVVASYNELEQDPKAGRMEPQRRRKVFTAMDKALAELHKAAKNLVDAVLERKDELKAVGEPDLQGPGLLEHSVRVAVSAVKLAVALDQRKLIRFQEKRANRYNLTRYELEDLAKCALLHDFGLFKLPFEEMTAGSNLNPLGTPSEEYRKHPALGYEICDLFELDTFVKMGAKYHEELETPKLGEGYPLGAHYPGVLGRAAQSRGLVYARIIQVADKHDRFLFASEAAVRSRFYAFELVRNMAGTWFDEDYAGTFLDIIPPYPRRSLVRLSDGKWGIVLDYEPATAEQPDLLMVRVAALEIGEYKRQGRHYRIERPVEVEFDAERSVELVKRGLGDWTVTCEGKPSRARAETLIEKGEALVEQRINYVFQSVVTHKGGPAILKLTDKLNQRKSIVYCNA